MVLVGQGAVRMNDREWSGSIMSEVNEPSE